MQLIRSDNLLRLLRNLSLLRRQKLRAHRSCQHIQQYGGKLLIPADIRIVADQMTHQRLRHRGVDGIHRHMVAVVRSPAKRQLGQVTGANHQSAALIGKIHKNLCALARLAILIGNIVFFRIMTNIPKMGIDSVDDADFLQRPADALNQRAGIFVGAAGRPKPRHGHTQNAAVRQI